MAGEPSAAELAPEDREEDLLGDLCGPGTSPLVRQVDGPVELAVDLDSSTTPAPSKSHAKAAEAAREKAARGDGRDHG